MRGMTSEKYFGRGVGDVGPGAIVSPKYNVNYTDEAPPGFVTDIPTYEEMTSRGHILKKENGDLTLWYSPELSLYSVFDMGSGYRYGSYKNYNDALSSFDKAVDMLNKYQGD